MKGISASATGFAFRASALAVGTSLVLAQFANAAVPPPPNDTQANAEVIGALPALIYGTSLNATDDINTINIAGIEAFVDGPDVFYSFTPAGNGTYRFQLFPWHYAPLRSSEWRFTIYLLDDDNLPVAGVRAPGSARPVNLDVTLTGGETYTFVVDHDAAASGRDNYPFTLVVDELPGPAPDNCGSALLLPAALPVVVVSDIDGAAHDFSFTQGAAATRCSVANLTTGPGIDHVYHFIPAADGDYAIDLNFSGFDAVVYVADSCPPLFPAGCLGAANHSTGGTTGGKHEIVVVTLEAGKDYFIYVDNHSTTLNSGQYVLIIDDAANYSITEVEPNDTFATASPVTTPVAGGQILGREDVDWWQVPGLTGDRVYAWVNNGGSTNSTLDTNLSFMAADGVTLIEYDDEDGDGISSPVNDLHFVYSTTSSVIAGAKFTSDGTHYLNVGADSATGTIHRYILEFGVVPATRNPLSECEPNDTPALADRTGKNFFAGVIPTAEDRDYYAFDAQIGDRIFIACDGDPERDSAGNLSANTDPNAFHAKIVVWDPDGDILIEDASDANTAQATVGPDYPAQATSFVARTAGTYIIEVGPQSAASQVGPTETYELAIFHNNAAPVLAEETDPVLVLTPDFMADTIDLVATDNQPGDTGICDISLFANDNLQIVGGFSPGDPVVNVSIELVDITTNGSAKLSVTDCAGNSACSFVFIDVFDPICDGQILAKRTISSIHDPLFVPDNQPAGPGILSTIEILDAGIVTDVNVTITAETTAVGDLDIFLISPLATNVDVVSDRGSSLAHNMFDARFDDDEGTSIMSISAADEPYTGTWLPDGNLSDFDGEQAQGNWQLNVRDDSSSQNGGSRLVRWELDITGTFPGPEFFDGLVTDFGDGGGIQSIVLNAPVNVQLDVSPSFVPGDQVVTYIVSLIDPTQNGTGSVQVTDLSGNFCIQPISLNGLPDNDAPDNTGGPTTEITYKQEAQLDVPSFVPAGVVSTITVPDTGLVGEVEVGVTVDTRDLGRLASTLTHDGEFASLFNRVGMTERQSVGLTKNTIDAHFDDDAPVEDDAHLEPALGTIVFMGPHQPDGRGEFIGDGINTDKRDNMLLNLNGTSLSGDWDLFMGDFRAQGTTRSDFRRWYMTVKNPCGPEYYVGRAVDRVPESGICSIALAGGASNLTVVAAFTPGDEVVDYRVDLVDPSLPGSGTLEITDCAGNTTNVAINLNAASGDGNLPIVSGSHITGSTIFQGSATDNQAGDTGVASVELLPWSDNLVITSVTPDPPGGAGSVDFEVDVVDGSANGRGYVRVTDSCGLRGHVLVEIDHLAPICTSEKRQTKRYFSGPEYLPIPDNDPTGVTSDIVVSDLNIISDVDVTFNITHGFDDDIVLTFVNPIPLGLISNRGSTGNDFIDTTLDDEAAMVLPDSAAAAPFTGSFQPADGMLSAFDGNPALGTYTLKTADNKSNDFGTFNHWSLVIESSSFPFSFDGRAEDSRAHDSGICSVELLPGAVNAVLTVDPSFVAGDAIVRYTVQMADPDQVTTAVVRVTDCAGNFCDQPVDLSPCPFGSIPLIDALDGDFAGWCMTPDPAEQVDFFVDAVALPERVAVLEIFKEFHESTVPINITFTQVRPDISTVDRIYIADEVIYNGTGLEWSDYHWSLSGGLESWFGVLPSGGFSVAPFTNKVFGGFIDGPANNKAKTLDADGGSIPAGGTFFPGAGAGELLIGIDLSSPSPVEFTLTQNPTFPAPPLLYDEFAACLSGHGNLPNPQFPVTQEICLEKHDVDKDFDVDLLDFSLIQLQNLRAD